MIHIKEIFVEIPWSIHKKLESTNIKANNWWAALVKIYFQK